MESTIFAGAVTVEEGGLFRRKPGQDSWESLQAGLPDRVKVYAIVEGRGDTLFVGAHQGVFRSDDGGESWADMQVPADGRPIYSMLVHPDAPDTIYAGSDPAAIFKSEDGGRSWRRLATVQPEGAITGCFPVRVLKMAIDPSDTDHIYAALEVGGVIRSLDGGESWEDISGGLLELSHEPHLRNCILSDDLTEGMMDLHALTVSAEQPGTLWIANRMGLFVSEDRGDSWREFGIGRFSDLQYGRDLMVSPHDPKVFVAALSDSSRGVAGSVYRSDDTGANWQRIDHDISIDSTLMTVTVSRRDPSRIFCGARAGQIFGTEDGGKNWVSLPLPDGVEDVRAVACL
ncbi:MAG: YCF48-related protein [Rhodospirillaceae bacterium]|nr:YCF48-related protein [Rhodospirillaceae bacterium]MDD9913189.1 YCF48-related protein [Rhodospirillaceae bacterium]